MFESFGINIFLSSEKKIDNINIVSIIINSFILFMSYSDTSKTSFFDDYNIIEFFDQYNDIVDDFNLSKKKKIERFSRCCNVLNKQYVKSITEIHIIS